MMMINRSHGKLWAPERGSGSGSTARVAGRTNSGRVQLPEMFVISPGISITKYEVSVGLFGQVMGFDYSFRVGAHSPDGPNVIEAGQYLRGTGHDQTMSWVSKIDARSFLYRLGSLNGGEFRLPTEGEWLRAEDRLSGQCWNWLDSMQPAGYSRAKVVREERDEQPVFYHILRAVGNENRRTVLDSWHREYLTSFHFVQINGT